MPRYLCIIDYVDWLRTKALQHLRHMYWVVLVPLRFGAATYFDCNRFARVIWLFEVEEEAGTESAAAFRDRLLE